MKSAKSHRSPVRNARSVLSYVPYLALVCLILSRTVLHQTRYEDSVLGFGAGSLLAYVLADLGSRVFPDAFQPREPEDSDLQTLGLNP